MFERDQVTLEVPSSLPNCANILLNLTQVKAAEARIQEVAFLTPLKAPELLSVFNQAWLEARRLTTAVDFELVRAKMELKRTKSRLVLDEVPKLLLEKGLVSAKNPAGSEDLREMILLQRPDYIDACDRVAQLEAVVRFLGDQAQALEMAYASVKKVLGDASNSHLYDRPNPNLGVSPSLPQPSIPGGGRVDDSTRAPSNTDPGPRYSGFGKPTY